MGLIRRGGVSTFFILACEKRKSWPARLCVFFPIQLDLVQRRMANPDQS
jgi:hypothetical protein